MAFYYLTYNVDDLSKNILQKLNRIASSLNTNITVFCDGIKTAIDNPVFHISDIMSIPYHKDEQNYIFIHSTKILKDCKDNILTDKTKTILLVDSNSMTSEADLVINFDQEIIDIAEEIRQKTGCK